MRRGQPISISDILPLGMQPDDLYIILASLAVFLIILAIGNSFIERDKLSPRLKIIQKRRAQLKQEYIRPTKRNKPEHNIDWIRAIVNNLQLIKDKQLEKINETMMQAGYRSKDAAIIYSFGKLVMPFVGLAIGFILADINWQDPFGDGSTSSWLIIIIGGYIGSKLPDYIISKKLKKRYHALRQALPDTLDLMLICAEAGLSLGATLDRVTRELGDTYPDMAEELSMTSIELGFLPDRNEALKNFAKRVDIQEVRSIVNMLQQTEKYGTPISQALRVLSKEFREERMLKAEQKAAKLPALMTIPMITLILPTLFIIVMAPAVIGMMDAF